MKGFHQQLCPKLQTCPQTPCEWDYHHKKWSLCWLFGPYVILGEGFFVSVSLCFFSTQLFSLCLRHCGSLAGNQSITVQKYLPTLIKNKELDGLKTAKKKLWRHAITKSKNMLNKRNISVHGHVPQPKTCIYWIYTNVWFMVLSYPSHLRCHDNQRLVPTLCPVQAKVP